MNLVYPQTSITGVVGAPISLDSPTVSGTVVSYAVTPALPAGLSFSTSTGAISGTPTAVSAQAAYTVTATNSSGSTTASIQITVNPAAPTSLTYPQTSITGTVGTAVAADTPTVTGTVTGYSINPALPAGLSLNTTTGTISGTPTAVTAQATYTITATNVSGSTTTTVQITINPAAPTGLTYSQPTITATVGTAITTDTPTVTGTVSTYGVSPGLPAGLSLNTTTGAISGTPTAAAAQATYTVTATNVSGSTTGTVQITITPAAPTNLVYPQTAISATVSETVPTDTPTVTGTVTSYSITPSLPAGLSFSSSTGTISGAPTATSAQATYTITASNAAGSTTATVQITVSSFSAFSLLDLGHANSIRTLRLQPTRVFSQDTSGHWVLWDYASATQLVSGDPLVINSTTPYPSDMAGSVLAIGTANAVEIRSSTDASLIATLTGPSLDPPSGTSAWWKLATDGSYIVSGYSGGLSVWSTRDGHLLFSLPGDYSSAIAFATPTQIQIAQGPSGASVIETDNVPAGTSSVGPAFTGTFNTWFSDGSHFITNTAGSGSPLSFNVYIYSAASTQQGTLAVDNVDALGGYANWFWINDPVTGGDFRLYPVGSTTPTTTCTCSNLGTLGVVAPFGSTVGLLPYGTPTAYILDLSGPTPTITQSTLPVTYDSVFAATSPTQWVVGNANGVVLDGASVAATPRFFGYGNVFSMAGAPGSVAIATAIGKILLYAPSSQALTGSIDFSSSKLKCRPMAASWLPWRGPTLRNMKTPVLSTSTHFPQRRSAIRSRTRTAKPQDPRNSSTSRSRAPAMLWPVFSGHGIRRCATTISLARKLPCPAPQSSGPTIPRRPSPTRSPHSCSRPTARL